MNNKTNLEIPDRSEYVPGGRVGVLLIHGLGGTPVELRFVARGLAHAGYTVYTMQIAGHCGTPEELRLSTWREWYGSVEAAHDRLRKSCDVIVAGGLSMGAILALHLAQNRPDSVHAVMALAPTLKLDGWSMPWYARVINYVRPTRIPLEVELPEHEPFGLKDERVRSLVVASMQSGNAGEAGVFSTPVRSFANMNALVATVKPRLKEIKQPALVIHPRDDDMASLRNALYLQTHLGGLVESVVLDDSYHIITLDQQRDIVIDRVTDFVDRVEVNLAAKAKVDRRRQAGASAPAPAEPGTGPARIAKS
jgi:carboxylesterase